MIRKFVTIVVHITQVWVTILALYFNTYKTQIQRRSNQYVNTQPELHSYIFKTHYWNVTVLQHRKDRDPFALSCAIPQVAVNT